MAFWYTTRSTVMFFTIALPDKIRLQSPSKNSLVRYLLSVRGESILIVSSDKAGFREQSGSRPIGKVNTEVDVYNKGQVKRFGFNKLFSSATLCGTNKLCVLVGKDLSIYDVSSDKAKYLFSVSGVNYINNMATGLLVARDEEILNLNVDTKKGFISYGFGEYNYCGLQNSGANYLLCITNADGKNAALYINPAASNADSIDKKIAALQQMGEVKDISAYGRYIFISPEFGELVYSNSLGEFSYNPQTVKVVSKKINQQIDSLGINRKKYLVNIIGAP